MTTQESITPGISSDAAAENWRWYEYTESRGHRDYCAQAKKNERYYLGKGGQWDPAVRAALESEGRPCYEVNELKAAVNVATGYQINNRMEVALYPRGGLADSEQAEIKAKVLRQMLDNEQYKWKETQVWLDGAIQQRGYFDIDVQFDENLAGSLSIDVLDPLDVRPDPDASEYDPDKWGFVIITRWQTLDWIRETYGPEAAAKVEARFESSDNWGDTLHDEHRNSFGDESGVNAYTDKGGIRRCRIIDRQYWTYEMTKVVVSPEGDMTPRDSVSDEDYAEAVAAGWVTIKRMMRRVKRCVSTRDVVLFDSYSPIDNFTVVPFFPIFRRGQTAGMIDDGISPQDMLNKAISQFQHVINTSANSGWVYEQGSIVNKTDAEMEESGAETGLILVTRPGATQPTKIRPNEVPSGIDRFIDWSLRSIRDVTGITEAMLDPGKNQSGVAIQARQFIAQQQLAVPLDNMARTRHMLYTRALKIIQKFVTDERVIRIAEKGETGETEYQPIVLNKQMDDGSVANDMTAGTYDIVITEKPMTVTWENSEFEQVMEMRKAGIDLPGWVAIKHSNLADKGELLKQQKEEAPPPDPLREAEAALKQAQARYADAQATAKSVESQYSATTAASLIAGNPAIAPLADAMLRSAGYVDQDQAPVIPAPDAPIQTNARMAENTHPIFPPNPDRGMTATPQTGINGGQQ